MSQQVTDKEIIFNRCQKCFLITFVAPLHSSNTKQLSVLKSLENLESTQKQLSFSKWHYFQPSDLEPFSFRLQTAKIKSYEYYTHWQKCVLNSLIQHFYSFKSIANCRKQLTGSLKQIVLVFCLNRIFYFLNGF